LLEDESKEIRLAAAAALKKIDTPAAAAAAEAFERDWVDREERPRRGGE
jgi:HEAT repeat protein